MKMTITLMPEDIKELIKENLKEVMDLDINTAQIDFKCSRELGESDLYLSHVEISVNK